jgi:flagellar protein FlaG
MNTLESSTSVSLTNLTSDLKSVDASVKMKRDSTDNKLREVSDKAQARNSLNGQAKEVSQDVLTPQQLENVAQQLQDFVGEMNRGLEFSVDKDSGRDVIKIIDKSSGDLVKQYPSEEVLTLVANLSDMVGGFVDTKV